MRVPVMQIRQMRMAVLERFVPVRVRMRRWPFAAAVRMLMMHIVRMQMPVRQRFMLMSVPVPLGEGEPGGCSHQQK